VQWALVELELAELALVELRCPLPQQAVLVHWRKCLRLTLNT
tara:strand:+ start:398 stop:523 length:126 start_codon:yes stop_codon:yes gene_type:complete